MNGWSKQSSNFSALYHSSFLKYIVFSQNITISVIRLPIMPSSLQKLVVESSASMYAASNGVKRKMEESLSDHGSSWERELSWEVRFSGGCKGV